MARRCFPACGCYGRRWNIDGQGPGDRYFHPNDIEFSNAFTKLTKDVGYVVDSGDNMWGPFTSHFFATEFANINGGNVFVLKEPK